MAAWLKMARWVDALNTRVAGLCIWLILVMTLISAGNAIVRKVFNTSSNGWLEIQWYLFSALFLLCAGYALLRNAHVRIDVVVGRFGPRVGAWIDLLGTLFFLLPVAGMIVYLSWGVFVEAWVSGERSGNEGGLIFWPARLLVPVGFALLFLQGLSEIIKRIAYLKGQIPLDDGHDAHGQEESLAEDIRRIRGLQEDSQ